jgi:hypothetical protein
VGSLRDVVHEPSFERELRRLLPNPDPFEEVAGALEFALARNPERGAPIPGTDLCIWPVYIRDAEWVVYYRFDDARVELVGLRESSADLW